MAVTLCDDFDSDQEGKFKAFTTTVVTNKTIDVKVESPSNEELSENADLQEAYNKLCKIVAKDAMTVDLSLKKIESPELEKKNL